MKLAINGGDPVRKESKGVLPYSTQEITKQDIIKVWESLESGWIAGNGYACKELEEKLANYTGYKHAVLVNSATTALYLAYRVVFDGKNSISMPSLTFVATANAAVNAGLSPLIVDVEKRTLVCEKCAVPVSYAGYPVFGGIVADDAHYIYPKMAKFKKQLVSCVSFHPVKHMTTGEGGALLTNDDSLAYEARLLANHGRDGIDCVVPGWNFRLPDINAALGLSQLERLNDWLVRKKNIAHTYQKSFAGLDLTLPAWHKLHAYHLYVLRLPQSMNREWFRKAMLAEGIGTQVHYPPLHTLSYYNKEKVLPNIDSIYPRLVSIPIFASMTDEDVHDVINAVTKIMENFI